VDDSSTEYVKKEGIELTRGRLALSDVTVPACASPCGSSSSSGLFSQTILSGSKSSS